MTAPALESRIESVTVFSSGALVTRATRLPRSEAAPLTSLRIPNLPLALEDASVRVRVDGGGATARDVRVTLDAPEREGAVSADEKKLREALREEKRLQAHVERLETELKRIEQLPFLKRPPGPEGEPPKSTPAEARLAALELTTRRSEQLAEEILRMKAESRKAEDRRKEIQDRVARASNAGRVEAHELRKAVVVRLEWPESDAADPVTLRVDYLVPGARWAPAYSWRLRRDGSAELSMRAVVAQGTGEDWNDVGLTLSTADVQRWVELPELRSLRIGRRQPAPAVRGWRPLPGDAAALYEDWDRSFGSQFRERAQPAAAPAVPDDLGAMLLAEPEEALAAGAAAQEAEVDFDDDVALGAPPPPVPSVTDGMSVARAMARPAPGLGSPLRSPPTMSMSLARRRARRPRAESPLRARDEMLAYGSLYMPSAGSPDRGQLVVTERVRLYTELLVERKVEIAFDLEQALAKASARARAAGSALPSQLTPAASDAEGYDHAFVAEGRVAIPSDRSHHTVPVARHGGEVAVRHVCVPRESRDVFRIAEMDNPFPAPLLPGPVEVSFDGSFLLTSRVPATPRGGRLRLGLGVDERVRVARNTRFHEETKGLTGGRLALAHEISVEVQNHSPDRVQLEVRERIPTTGPDEKEIEVALGEVTPPWREYEPEPRGSEPPLRGGHHWQISLDPGEKATLRAPYTIRISSRHELSGGNRRE